MAVLIFVTALGYAIWVYRDVFPAQSGSAGEAVSVSANLPESDSAPGETIRIVTWNIEWFPGRSPDAPEELAARHMLATRRVIPTLEADVYLLQEMGSEEAVRMLFERMRSFTVHIVTQFRWRNQPGRQQLAIVSRLPGLASFMESFERSEDGVNPPRGFAFAALELPNGRPLLVYSVHLKSNIGDSASNIAQREESARQIVAHAEEMKTQFERPIIVIGGDFNTLMHQPEMAHERTFEILREAGFYWTWEGVPFSERVTWEARGRFGDANFDHLFIYGGQPTTAFLLPNPDISDHNPVGIDLVID